MPAFIQERVVKVMHEQMSIIFICGSGEQGKDGVGDYTRLLACALTELGLVTAVLAINDKHIDAYAQEKVLTSGGIVNVYRFPRVEKWTTKLNKAKKIIDELNPDWVSLQYVPFSFEDRGIPFGFPSRIKKLVAGRKTHIMFHELWVGIKKESPFIHSIYKFFQKGIARSLVNRVQPKTINTSNKVYQMALQGAGIESQILPLFSNIPLAAGDDRFEAELMQELNITINQRNKWEIYCVFGSIFPDIKLDTVISANLDRLNGINKRMALIFLGRGNAKEIERLRNTWATKVNMLSLGELSPQKISGVLRIVDKAISTTPLEFIGKSGVFAVLRRHGVEVFCPFNIEIPEGFIPEMKAFYQYLQSRQPEEWDVKNIAKKIYDDFSMYTHL